MGEKRPISIDLRQLEYFVALAESETISRAASRLGISQPSLSESLTRLESHLDVVLVIRSARGTQLTEAGAALAKYSRDILKSVDVALNEVRHLGGEARGPVSIGLPQGIALLLSVPLAETVQIDLPAVRLRISEGGSGHVREWLETGEIDFAVLYHGHDYGDVDAQALLEEDLFLVAAPDNWPPASRPAAPAQQIEFKELKGLPLVLPNPRHGLRDFIERFARSNSVPLDVTVEMDSLRQIATLVSRASAYTIVPHVAVMNEVSRKELVLIPIVRPAMQRTAYIVRKRGRPVTQASLAVQRLVSVILQEMIARYELNMRLLN